MNKSVLVTGASGLIGKSIVKKFQDENWKIYAQVRSSKNVSFGDNVEIIEFDLGKESGKNLISQISQLDLVINCAANQEVIPASEMSAEKAAEIFQINTIAPFEIAVAAKSKGANVVINISSIEGDVARPGHELYGATKAALDSITRSLANSLAPMRVNGIRLGLVGDANLTERWPSGVKAWNSLVPGKRFASPAEVAAFVFQISSTDFDYATGAIFDFDGGKSAAPGW
jgi:NAD(P)-dependent dehydrogenase (short-subunit alcohol dehydrogenase family)